MCTIRYVYVSCVSLCVVLTASVVLHELYHSVNEGLLYDGRVEGSHGWNLHHLLQVLLGDLRDGFLQPSGCGWLKMGLYNTTQIQYMADRGNIEKRVRYLYVCIYVCMYVCIMHVQVIDL